MSVLKKKKAGGVKDKIYMFMLERLYCWVLLFQFMEIFKLVLAFAIIVFINKHPGLHYLLLPEEIMIEIVTVLHHLEKKNSNKLLHAQ